MAVPAIIGAALPFISNALDKFFTDKDERAKAEEEVQQALVEALSKTNEGQLLVNKTEAQHRSVWVAGWRPFIGWVCGIGLAYKYLLQPLLQTLVDMVSVMAGIEPFTVSVPQGWDELFTLLMGLLGLGTLRTYEKKLGVTK